MKGAKRIVFDNDPSNDPADGAHMEFRLTYAGPLLSSGNEKKHKKADHKHMLRKAFHPKLKRLWEITPFLKAGRGSRPEAIWDHSGKDVPRYNPN